MFNSSPSKTKSTDQDMGNQRKQSPSIKQKEEDISFETQYCRMNLSQCNLKNSSNNKELSSDSNALSESLELPLDKREDPPNINFTDFVSKTYQTILQKTPDLLHKNLNSESEEPNPLPVIKKRASLPGPFE